MAGVLKIEPGAALDLGGLDPSDTDGVKRKDADARLEECRAELGRLQELLWGAKVHAVLIVLQGLDTSGKDGTISHVMGLVNPQGCRVESFKVPTADEAAHDFLWRAHRVTPARGTMTIFNRSYYEDVLVVRVHKLVPADVWRRRYAHINHFESLLADERTIVLKFFLHISQEEQKQRLLEREQDPGKAWKLSAADWVERRSWSEYLAAYEEALQRCSTKSAPWYVVPADHKWYRNYAVARAIIDVLRPYAAEWEDRLQAIGETARQEIKRARQEIAASARR